MQWWLRKPQFHLKQQNTVVITNPRQASWGMLLNYNHLSLWLQALHLIKDWNGVFLITKCVLWRWFVMKCLEVIYERSYFTCAHIASDIFYISSLIYKQHHMMTSWNGNSFRVTESLWVEFTGHRWIPLTKASDAELWCFLGSAPEQAAE